MRVSAQERVQASVLEPAQEQAIMKREQARRRWRSGRIPDCGCGKYQRRLWMVSRNVAREYDFFCLRTE